jgi:thioredoxin-related protein
MNTCWLYAATPSGLEAQYGNQITFERIEANTEDGSVIMRAYRIQGHPTFLLLDQNGREINRLIGPQPAETMEQAISLPAGDSI